MPFLTVAGINLEILVAGATQEEGDHVGAVKRAFSGMYRSSRQLNKERYRFTVGPITQTDAATLRAAAAANGGIVACSGDAITSGNYLVTIPGSDFVQDSSESTDFRRTVSLTLERA